MSFKILVLEPKHNMIHAISDKRGVVKGELISDDIQKIRMVAPNVYFMAGKYLDLFDNCYRSLVDMADQPASAIIKKVNQFDRRITPTLENPKATHDEATLFGLFDDGKAFIWNSNPDGTSDGVFPINSRYIKMGGGRKGTQETAHGFFMEKLSVSCLYPIAMIETIRYAASIDKVISPTFDFIQIDVKNQVSGEFVDMKTSAHL